MSNKEIDPVDKIEKGFDILKTQGIEAKNPDQSTAMTRTFVENIDTCRWKGFNEKDIKIMFKTAQKFESFLESLKGCGHDTLIESIKEGFQACCETTIDVEEKQPSFEERVNNFQTSFRHRLEDFEAVQLANFIHEMNNQHVRKMHPDMKNVQGKLVAAWEAIKSVMSDWGSEYV